MKITITGSTGNISKPLAQILIAAGHELTIVSSNSDKTAEIEALGAKAAIGSLTDVTFIASAFTGADAVYAMVPPNFGAPSLREYQGQTGKNYAEAIRQSGVKRVVALSSIGAHLSEGTGPIKGVHDVEGILSGLEDVAIKFIRAPFFYINLFNDIPMIKTAGILGANYPADARLVMVHPTDIAAAVAEELQQSFAGKSVRYLVSDETTTGQLAKTLGAAIGKPELPWVEFTDEQAYGGMTQHGVPEEMVKNFVEMGTAIRSGAIWEDYDKHQPTTSGKIKLTDFAKEFAAVYNA
ncbi:NmrA family NAD(P)-binding protein [Mucilaginibacter flavus]|uniref:NmrA family NAD(P)-binding protein n=1 Tax=Mucilaginibacter flavus TaxID=931504 RepID=UPI0025B5C71C|nr:NAD(P)H-binding protein [Mucilaginibacter flavus]MDN3580311.1 NAD(P)H-binding protein [Mucilaginibacter flavus]